MSHICTGVNPHRVRPRPAAARTSSTPPVRPVRPGRRGRKPPDPSRGARSARRACEWWTVPAATPPSAAWPWPRADPSSAAARSSSCPSTAAAATRRSPGQPVDQLAPRVDQLVLDLLPVGVQPDRVGVVAQLLALRLDQRVLIGQQPLLAGQQLVLADNDLTQPRVGRTQPAQLRP